MLKHLALQTSDLTFLMHSLHFLQLYVQLLLMHGHLYLMDFHSWLMVFLHLFSLKHCSSRQTSVSDSSFFSSLSSNSDSSSSSLLLFPRELAPISPLSLPQNIDIAGDGVLIVHKSTSSPLTLMDCPEII
jgi:hypothetical protein